MAMSGLAPSSFNSGRHGEKMVLSCLGLLLPVLLLVGCGQFWNIRSTSVAVNSGYLTVMSYNIRVGYGTKELGANIYELAKRPYLFPPIVDAIRSVDPDVVGLQEVAGFSQAERIAKSLNMNFAYIPHGLDDYGNWWGVAVLSKYRIVSAWGEQISPKRESPARSPRSVLVCKVDIGGVPVAFVSIHRDHELHSGNDVKAVMSAVAKVSGPVVLIGDLNFTPFDRRTGILKKRFVDTVEMAANENARLVDQEGTFPLVGRIDYIFVDPTYFEVLDVGLIAKEHWDASDHRGYYAKIRLKR